MVMVIDTSFLFAFQTFSHRYEQGFLPRVDTLLFIFHH